MSRNFGIDALAAWSLGPSSYVARHDARKLMEVDLVRAMRKNPDAVAESDSLYHVTIEPVGSWTVDTRVPGGRVSVGLSGQADCTFWMTQETLDDLLDKKLSPEWAVLRGRLRVSNISVARRLASILREV